MHLRQTPKLEHASANPPLLLRVFSFTRAAPVPRAPDRADELLARGIFNPASLTNSFDALAGGHSIDEALHRGPGAADEGVRGDTLMEPPVQASEGQAIQFLHLVLDVHYSTKPRTLRYVVGDFDEAASAPSAPGSHLSPAPREVLATTPSTSTAASNDPGRTSSTAQSRLRSDSQSAALDSSLFASRRGRAATDAKTSSSSPLASPGSFKAATMTYEEAKKALESARNVLYKMLGKVKNPRKPTKRGPQPKPVTTEGLDLARDNLKKSKEIWVKVKSRPENEAKERKRKDDHNVLKASYRKRHNAAPDRSASSYSD